MNLLDEIAARAGVSPSTVSRALSGKHNPQRKAAISRYQKICDIARQLGYRPNAAARAMASKERQTLQLGILHYNPETAIFTNLPLFEMFLGVQQVMQQHQVNLNFVTIHNCDDTPWVFTENWLEGIIVAGVVPAKLCERIRNLFQHVVWLDTNVQEEVNCVLRDEELAGRMAATALIEAGATQIIWLSSRELSSPAEPHYSSPLRFRGVCTVAQHHNIPLVIGPITQPEDMTPDFWQKHLTPTTGVVADYHYLAQGLHNLLSTHPGLTPPTHYKLTCCDGDHTMKIVWPQLARVQVDRFHLGIEAAQMLLKKLENNSDIPSVTVAGTWIPGNTI